MFNALHKSYLYYKYKFMMEGFSVNITEIVIFALRLIKNLKQIELNMINFLKHI